MDALEKITEKILATKWHWLKYHFPVDDGGRTHPLSRSIADSCEICEQHMPRYVEEFANRLSSYKDREKYLPHFEQIIQLLSELFVISHLASLSLEGFRYIHEPKVEGSNKNPELGMYSDTRKLFVEVKCGKYIEHHNNRSDATIQLPSRMEGIREVGESLLNSGETLVLPRDNPIKDFLISANDKFDSFKKCNADSICVLVIVWNDFIFEPISALINRSSGLLTENSFLKKEGSPIVFNNIDAIILVRHSHHIVRATRDKPLADRIRHPLDWGYKLGFLPKALVPVSGSSDDIKFISELFDAIHIEELQNIAEYRPQEIIFNV